MPLMISILDAVQTKIYLESLCSSRSSTPRCELGTKKPDHKNEPWAAVHECY